MAINVGVKALLCWVNTLKLSDREITIDDLQDGTVLLKVVCVLKREHNCHFSNSTEERFKLIADFVERDCRFTATKGTSVSWDNIRHEINLTVEIAKVLLLLIYHDMMNERCTVNSLECHVEQEIAHLTESFVMESDGCVFLSKSLDAYLARRRISVSREIFEQSATTSVSNVSTISSLTDDESPVFDRRQRVTFVDMQTVASSSVSNSPLQNIMNTPKFQLRKMERQMIRERDHRDGLESELASKIALLAQRESHCNQLQYCLDKLKKEQHEQENFIKDQINELESKNSTLQMRLNEMLKHNKDLKSNSTLMERKVDELSDENGVLSSQMRAVCSQLAIFEAEVGRLTETQAFSEEDWRSKTGHLQSELNQATAQKELLTEQIQILQGKISYLEDVISRAAKEEVGENMGPVMERDMLDTEIKGLKHELESTSCSLKKAEVEIRAKTQQLAEYQQELNQQKGLMQQQESQTEEIIQAKDGILDKLQKEITEQRAVLQQEILDLKIQLEQVTQQKTEQITRLQQHIDACEQEIENLKEIKKEKESLLRQTDENVKDLKTKLSAATCLLADKDQQIISLREEVDILTDETKNNKNEIQAKEEMLAKLLLEKSNEQDIFHNKIQTLSVQVKELSSSLKQAEQEIQLKQDLLAKTQQENVQQREVLQQQIVTCEEEVQKLNKEMQVKNEQLVILKNDSSRQSESLEQEITGLKAQLENLNDSLRKAEEQVQAQKGMLTKQEEQSSHQTVVLQQQLSASEERVRTMKEEIQIKEEQMNMLKNQSLEQSELLHQEIQDLKKQVECICSSLKNAEEHLKSKENLLAQKSKQEQQSTLQIDALGKHSAVLEEEVNRLREDIRTKEREVDLLKVESCKESEVLQKEIHTLRDQVQSFNESFKTTIEQLQAKEYLLTEEKDKYQNMTTTSEEEIKALKEQIQSKEEQLVTIEKEGSKHSEMLQQEIQCLKNQLANMGDSLTKAEEEVQTQVAMLTKQEQESAHQKEILQQQLSASEEEVMKMKDELQAKEEQMMMLKTESSEQSDLRHQEIQSLKEQVECLSSSLKNAEENLQSKEHMFAEQQLHSTQDMEALQVQMVASHDEVKRLNAEIQVKEEQLVQLKTETSTHSELLQQEIESLNKQINTLSNSLEIAKDQVQAKEDLMAKQEQQSTLQIDALGKHSAFLEEEVNRLREDIRTKEREVDLLKVESCKESEVLQKEIHTLRDQVQSLNESLKTTIEQLQAKEYLLTQKEMEISQAKDTFQNMTTTSEEEIKALNKQIQSKEEQLVTIEKEGSKHSEMLQQEIQCLKNQLANMGDSLTKAEEEVQTQVAMLTKQEQESAHQKEILQQQLSASEEEVMKMKDELQAKEEQMMLLKTESSEQSDLRHQEIQSLKEQVECLSSSLKNAEENLQSKEHMFAQQQQENKDIFQLQLVSVNAELNHYKETQAADLRLKEAVQVATLSEKEALVQEKEVLMARILQAEKNQKALEKQLEAMVFENERLAQAKQAIKKENEISHKLESVLQQELETIRTEKEKLLKEKAEVQQQLSAKSEAAEHYKAQMEKAVNHYNGKKQLLQESQEETVELKHSLEVKEREVKATTMEIRLLKLDLDKAQTNEKALLNRVASLEAQLAFADRNLRIQNKIHEGSATESGYLDVRSAYSSVHTRAQVKRSMSDDSLDHSSLEDSLTTTRKLTGPDESSTPLVRSSERLAAKRCGLQTESLETLYFTPINTRQVNRTSTEHKLELDSARKNPTSSVKRRRTTQVINITMTQKTPGGSEHDDTFYSLASARSQPNLSSANTAQPMSIGLFDTPASDQFISLPGYRRSTVRSQTTSTLYAGEENEPDGAPEDWMRIAELQARNKACLPHLKSSYPVESDTGRGSTFLFTDEELRMGDPSDTIRRASMMPGQMQDSLASHRHSLMVGQTGAAASTRSHRLSLMPGQLPSKTVSSSQLRSPKGTKRSSSSLSVHQTSPEKRMRASCFPRPLTPKNRNVISGPSSSQIQGRALSPADRRQSMMFTIDNTPKNNNYLKKGLNKLRGSARKSPGKSVKKLPAQTSVPSGAAVVRAGRVGSSKSPQVTTKGQKATSRSAKSPGLTASARKMMSRMKV
ncbi:nuclear mitotic apparatus protein 1 isoform X3 [Sander lucioperca]|uniref:nuclear mitotic apparatus protein 1 isoform X3 n=1 Tax=Sander lucioperca TaxID=283035 RepID=UPI00125D72CC|nr:nuclear mitotic apparatus protein 1 isoform X3 [Sander lucioperca]